MTGDTGPIPALEGNSVNSTIGDVGSNDNGMFQIARDRKLYLTD